MRPPRGALGGAPPCLAGAPAARAPGRVAQARRVARAPSFPRAVAVGQDAVRIGANVRWDEGRRASDGGRSESWAVRTAADRRGALPFSFQRADALARLAALLTPPSDAAPGRGAAAALLAAAAAAPRRSPDERTRAARVPGCAAPAWVVADVADDGTIQFRADADAALTRGAAAALAASLSGLTPAALATVTAADVEAAGLAAASLPPSRAGGAAALLASFRARARAAAAGGGPPPFPSLIVGRGSRLEPRGAFAEAQAAFLAPPAGLVADLAASLRAANVGVVAHFYMDPEVQGALAAAAAVWPHIKISDSLAMADAAVGMADAGVSSVAVLGVDFMSENVRAILDDAGHTAVDVLRADAAPIGCTLADAADAPAYASWLAAGAAAPGPALHVVYINTSLSSKAGAHAALPTITCTSSNVVSTVLTAFAEIPALRVLYGPDAYMGANLVTLLSSVAALGDGAARALHPAHDASSLSSALARLDYFRDGKCAVHDMFGADVAAAVDAHYGDALLAAHFEVPGELFALALAAQRATGRGVVGSTQNILDFVLAKLDAALEAAAGEGETVRVVLGTETGMTTAIVRAVAARLDAAARDDVDVEIVFPVAADAVTAGRGRGGSVELPGGLALVPGPAGGEGCSAAGGCASCPYMKMNTLGALRRVVDAAGGRDEGALAPLRAARRADALPGGAGGGASVAALGCAPILHMRGFQRGGRLPPALVADVVARGGGGEGGGGG